MTESLDELMEKASEALVGMDYLTCESLCLVALKEARASGNWAYFAAILLPLQEARRQRRMIAAEGIVRLGSQTLRGGLKAWLASCNAGCIVLTHPHTLDDARELVRAARHGRRFIEVLLADNAIDATVWKLRSFQGGDLGVSCDVPAPDRSWIDKNVKHDKTHTHADGKTPADWFIDASETLGDAALDLAARETQPSTRFDLLEKLMDVVTDHELLHQALGKTARTLALLAPSTDEATTSATGVQ